MPTVLQEYRSTTQTFRPGARLKVIPCGPGSLPDYQIVDGAAPLSETQISPTAAWSEAAFLLAQGREPNCAPWPAAYLQAIANGATDADARAQADAAAP